MPSQKQVWVLKLLQDSYKVLMPAWDLDRVNQINRLQWRYRFSVERAFTPTCLFQVHLLMSFMLPLSLPLFQPTNSLLSCRDTTAENPVFDNSPLMRNKTKLMANKSKPTQATPQWKITPCRFKKRQLSSKPLWLLINQMIYASTSENEQPSQK